MSICCIYHANNSDDRAEYCFAQICISVVSDSIHTDYKISEFRYFVKLKALIIQLFSYCFSFLLKKMLNEHISF
jgi:hypothetical protein